MTDEKNTDNAQNENKLAPEANGKEANKNPLKFYKDLVKQAQELAKDENWQKAGDELNTLSHLWSDGPTAEGDDQQDQIKELFYKFTKATQAYEARKEQEIQKQQQQRKQNESQKKELLSSLKQIVKNEDWSQRGKVQNLQNQWTRVGALPGELNKELNEEFGALVKEFKSHKIDLIVEKRQKQEDNLILKMTVLDKMAKVIDQINSKTSAWKEIDKAFDDLTHQWKKMGRVPREKADEVWKRYKDSQDAYYDAKYKFDSKHRKLVDKFSAKKTKLCQQAEELMEQDLLAAVRKVNGLHHRWKKTGNLPQRKEDKLWDRFKAAIDAFNQKLADNRDTLEEKEQANYKEKEALISTANEIKETTEWDKGHQQMQTLMDRWKKAGPVTQRHSNELWKQFKGAMDSFYDHRREALKESDKEQKKNLEQKKEIIDKIRELGTHEDPVAAVNTAKSLQATFKDVGYVPIKKKNEVWKEYREVCDVIYNRLRAAQSGDKFDRELAKAQIGHEQRSEIQQLRKKYKKVEKEVKQLQEEVLQYQETKSYFTSSSSDNPLLKEMQAKIDNTQASLDEKEDELAALDKEMDILKEDS